MVDEEQGHPPKNEAWKPVWNDKVLEWLRRRRRPEKNENDN